WVNDGPPWPLTISPVFSRPCGVELERPLLERDRRPSFAIADVSPLYSRTSRCPVNVRDT
ncbi:MAG TPA: hypothetical protein VE760_07085, partial [Acidimicrobiales bacterium]|nr:hypothetical protein [Acidimicrobiales bacterium]